MELTTIGGFGPVETPCKTGHWFWYRERHQWTEWEPDSEGDYKRECTVCPWVEFASDTAKYQARLDAIRARLEAGERIGHIINGD